VQEYDRGSARLQASLLFLATIGILIPSAVSEADAAGSAFTARLSVGLSVLLIAAYGLGLLFSLKTHRELFGGADHAETSEAPWPMGLALATLAGVTVLVALVSEVFVESVQEAAVAFGMTPAFVGFIVVALVGGRKAPQPFPVHARTGWTSVWASRWEALPRSRFSWLRSLCC
jgi:Ca2+:H+ antiporter